MKGMIPPVYLLFGRLLSYIIGIGIGVIIAGATFGEPWGLVALCLLTAAAVVSWGANSEQGN